MHKNENPIILALILCIITGATALLLAFSNNLTKDLIMENSQKEQEIAKKQVITAGTYIEIDYVSDGIVKAVYEAKNGDNLIGYCINVAPTGFGGEIDMMVGVDTEHKVTGVKIISMSETAGLGSKAQNTEFTDQFKNKAAGNGQTINVIKSGEAKSNEIIAITGATVTSTAIKDGVEAACNAVLELAKEGNHE